MAKKPPNHHIPHDLRLSDELLVRAAETFGTPLYIYDNAMFEHSWRTLQSSLPRSTVIHYSVKANPNISIIHTFRGLGARFEVASLGELKATTHAGVPPSDIIFVGPGKSKAELSEAISLHLQAIVVESLREINDVQELSNKLNKQTRVALRLNPGFGKGALAMGGATQFGMEPEVALRILVESNAYFALEIVGVHGYLGARILDWKAILEHTRSILEQADELQRKSGKEFTFIDVGGGIGIPYYERDTPLDLDSLRRELSGLVSEYLEKYPKTELIAVESGRFLAGPAGAFVTRVLDVKKYGNQCFVILDGGINVFGGHDMYVGSRPMPTRVLNRTDDAVEEVTLCGPLCTPLDRLAGNILLPVPGIGDLVTFYLAGAYGFTASPSLFLSHGFPCEILYVEDELVLIRERLSPDRLLADQPFPASITKAKFQ